ncbi:MULTISPECIES: TetR/AcrR family transcriptional regulator C-terminal domain-containing protein [Arthrobacter]|uniref:TetR/AcrR family transcriptional regulator C-terminal domain-containing protein n=2 Tax=Arthrobacter TaxID=1663 RepID=A0ABU9KHM4_9MICC|nr:TetR/AcrR family transcriptional regulator C-terminal domain-containing protein [Arthrobacter sp. YJM1]MDP5226608.1 TetR/AcrR family transcriptional regulator C-terminal domain-containing protein [Arthrobacter sp. YJM1]
MNAAVPRKAGRPTRSVLDRGLIIRTAFDVLKRTGPDDFTMAALAQELGVKTPALYHHVGNKNQVLSSMRELITASVDSSGFSRLSWPDATRLWARSYRTAFAAHPHVIALFATTPVTGANPTLTMYEAVTRGFLAEGWPEELAVSAIVSLENFILGSALDAVAPADIFDPGDFTPEVPSFARALDARRDFLGTPGPSAYAGTAADQAFELGLDALLHGLQHRLARILEDRKRPATP